MKTTSKLTLALTAALVLYAATSSFAAGGSCSYDPAAPLKFHTSKKYILDQHGRVAMLRGANLGICYYKDGIGFTQDNLDGLKRYGFNFIRLNLGWDHLEPEKGKHDNEKMKKIVQFIKDAQKNGIYTMPDFHQMMWEAHIPEWMRDSALGHGYLSETNSVAIEQANRFWASDTIQADLIDFLVYLAENFKDADGLFGYDLFNEPFSIKGTSYALFEKCCLFPFYEKAIPAVRAVDPTTPIVLEPQPQTVVLPAFTRPFKYDNIVWSPHVYFPHSYGPTGLVIQHQETPDDVRKKYKRFQKDSDKMGAPMLIGEYGGDPNGYAFAGPWLMENMTQQDEYFAGSAIWSFSATGGGGWNINDTPKTLSPVMEKILLKPYPRYTAGTPIKLAYDPEKKSFSYKYTSDPAVCAPTEIFYPADLFAKSKLDISSACDVKSNYDAAAQTLTISAGCGGPVEVKVSLGE